MPESKLASLSVDDDDMITLEYEVVITMRIVLTPKMPNTHPAMVYLSEQDDDGAVRLGLKADDLVKTTGISNDECALVVEALNEFVARRPLTVT